MLTLRRSRILREKDRSFFGKKITHLTKAEGGRGDGRRQNAGRKGNRECSHFPIGRSPVTG